MDEMNRRQKWDRSFENRLLSMVKRLVPIGKKEEEDRRRMKWDEEHIGPLTADRDGGQLLQPPPDIPPIDPKTLEPFQWVVSETMGGQKMKKNSSQLRYEPCMYTADHHDVQKHIRNSCNFYHMHYT
jgi:hypothetical protein